MSLPMTQRILELLGLGKPSKLTRPTHPLPSPTDPVSKHHIPVPSAPSKITRS